MNSFIRLKSKDDIYDALKTFEDCFPHLIEKVVSLSDYAEKLSESANVYILTDGSITQGFLSFYSNDYDTKRGFITLLGVLPAFQKYGLGKIMMKFCIDNMRKDGMKKARLEVDGDNLNAQNFYEHMGFIRTSANGITSFFMEKTIDNA